MKRLFTSLSVIVASMIAFSGCTKEEIVPAVDGRIVAVCAKQGDMVVKGEIVAFVQE